MIRFLLLFGFISQLFAQTSVENAKLLLEAKKNSEAKHILLAITKERKDFSEAQFLLGQIEYNANRFDEAADYFEKAVSSDEKVAKYHLWLGNCYGAIAQNANVLKQGYLAPKMKSEWERALQLDSKLVEARFSLIAFYTQAPTFMGGSMEKAKEMAREIIKTNGAEGHIELGNIYFKEKNFNLAEKEYATASKVDTKYRTVLGNFYINQKRYDEANRYFEELLQKDPSDFTAMFQIGRVSAISHKNLQHGADLLILYLAHKPESNEPPIANANLRLAEIYEKQGKNSDALKHYKEALRLNAKLNEAKEGLDRLSKR